MFINILYIFQHLVLRGLELGTAVGRSLDGTLTQFHEPANGTFTLVVVRHRTIFSMNWLVKRDAWALLVVALAIVFGGEKLIVNAMSMTLWHSKAKTTPIHHHF